MSDWVEIVNKDGNYKTEVIGFHETINFTIVLDENKISKWKIFCGKIKLISLKYKKIRK